MSTNGKRVAIGAPYNDGIGNGRSIGSTRVYEEVNGTSWKKVGDDIDGELAGDYSGWSVSTSSDGN